MVVSLTIIGGVVAWAMHVRAIAAVADCIHSLTVIDGTKRQWALDHDADSNTVPALKDLIVCGVPLDSPYACKYAHCPSGGKYTIGRVDDFPICSVHGLPLCTYEHEWGEHYHRVQGVDVAVLYGGGRRLVVRTSKNGDALIKPSILSNAPVAIVISKQGYMSVSNSLQFFRSNPGVELKLVAN